MDWASGSCLLARVLEVFGDGRLTVLESRFGEVLVLVGLVLVGLVLVGLAERVFDDILLTSLREIVMTSRMRDGQIDDNVTAAKERKSERERTRRKDARGEERIWQSRTQESDCRIIHTIKQTNSIPILHLL
jgi:hypothetical protein